MYCPNCGRQVGDGFAFCPECSASLAVVGQALAPGAAQQPGTLDAAARELRAKRSRVGLLYGVVFALIGVVTMVSLAADEQSIDPEAALGMGIIAFVFLLLVLCFGYLSRRSGFGYAAGVGFGLVLALGALVCLAISASEGSATSIWLWLFDAALFGASAFGFRGLLWFRSERRTRAASAKQAKCPSCGRPVEPAWTTCRGCAAPLGVSGVRPVGSGVCTPTFGQQGLMSDRASTGAGLGKAVTSGSDRVIAWLLFL